MKKSFTLFLLLISGVNILFAQDEALKPTVMQPVYFDISPPLRDMVQRSDAKVDLSWKEGIVKNRLNTVSNDNTVLDYPVIDAVQQVTFGDAMPNDTTIQNFEGVGANGYYPPDTHGDVSPSNYFQVTNVRFAIYNKNGVKLLGPSNNNTIFNGLPNNTNDGDAVVLWDENAQRWLFSQFALPNYPNGPFYQNVAISQTSDPTGTWYRYQYTFTDMPDYPKLSVWGDGYYMTMRRFASGSGSWLGPAAAAMDRTKMLVGNTSAAIVKFNLPSSSEGPQPADCDSPFPADGTPCPVCYLTQSTVKLYDFHVDWVTPSNATFTSTNTINITPFSAFGNSNSIPQKNTSQLLDPMSGKRIMYRMPYRTFSDHASMLLNTTVNVGGKAGIRWMELRYASGAWSVYQEGTYAPSDGNYRWMGSIAMDSIGNIALGYSISSSTMFPSIRYTGRLANDPLGQMTMAEKAIINGGGSQTNADGRWGDYSAMTADPSVLGKFWYTQEYFSSTGSANWKTRVGSFSFSNVFSIVTSANPPLICIGDSSELSVNPNGGSGTYTFSWTSNPPGFTSTLQNPMVSPSDTTMYYVSASDGTTTLTDSVQVSVMPMPIVSAGADTTVCWYVTSVPAIGTAQYYRALGWTTTGSGTFTNPSSLVTTYNPSLNDKINGSVDLKLIVISNIPCSGNVTSTKHVVFDVCTGMAGKVDSEPGLLIQPNPAHESVTIGISGISSGSSVLSITSMDGSTRFREKIDASATTVLRKIDLSGFADGVYFVQLKSGKKTITQKMVVQ